MNNKILITGAAGFIGFHTARKLLEDGFDVLGIDNLNDYYDVNLKKERLKEIETSLDKNKKWELINCDIVEIKFLENIFSIFKPEIVINLAAQAGVRYSIENPKSYIDSNIVGFANILECCRNFKVKHLIYASSSSVYGGNKNLPFMEDQGVNHPVSLYASTKRSNELMAHTYSHLFNLPTTGLRFFTVYGPWGRPDMSYFIFTKKILKNEPIQIFNNGKMKRDFTFIDDVVLAIKNILFNEPKVNNNFDYLNTPPSLSWAPFRLFNVGNSNPIELMDFVKVIETELGITAKKEFLNMQPGDVEMTSANIEKLSAWSDYKPKTSIKSGMKKFIKWYKEFYRNIL